jgi:ribosomal protein S18 acetylase RimI-like enzyme
MRIAADTAAFGEPVEAFLDDRQLFCDVVYRYYLDFEPERAWVAVIESDVVGFLVGCTDTVRRNRLMATRLAPRLAWDLLRRRYRVGRRTWQYVRQMLGAGIRREFPKIDGAQYPAHLHMNVAAASRGAGAGRRLLEAHLAQLRTLDVPGVHLRTTSLNAAAVALYTRNGFCLLDVRPTGLWRHVRSEPVENLAYGLRLS